MSTPVRHTAVVYGRLQSRELRLEAARARRMGQQVMTIEQLACRLAGGFSRPIDDETLRLCVQEALLVTDVGELEAIKLLPGMVDACVETLHKVWSAKIDLASAGPHPRLKSLAALETAILERLPPGMQRPGELVDAALPRLSYSPAVIGTVDIIGMTELEPCWRPLLQGLTGFTRVRWVAGPRHIPEWLKSTAVEVATSAACEPERRMDSAATALHEVIEALRWARQLIASGVAKPSEIGIASNSPGDFDDHFLALRSDANLNLHFAHGFKVTATRDGQATAALADILLRGISQRKLRRLCALTKGVDGFLSEFPDDWHRVLPSEAPLSSDVSWGKLLNSLSADDWPDKVDHTPKLRTVVEMLAKGHGEAAVVGETLLRGRALGIWRKALAAGPAASLDRTLESMREDDGLEACESVVWLPASSLAASPRPYVRLLGLNSSRWPRRISEDRLLSDHIISKDELDPLPVSESDRRDFETILRTTQREVALSYARRDSEGRLLGRSGLLQDAPDAQYLQRHRLPAHAFSESDRLMARPMEFRATPQAMGAERCWRSWMRREITPNDGLVRTGHPAVMMTLERVQSASSLSLLLRNPLGFVWKYGLRLQTLELAEEPLVLDPLAFGNLVHEVLDAALQLIVAQRGLGVAVDIPSALRAAVQKVSSLWESLQPIPPRMLWQRTLREVEQLALYALTATEQHGPDWSSFSEVPFGMVDQESSAAAPWDPTVQVIVPDTGFRIRGYIDRLDLSNGRSHAVVFDYKTGKAPGKDIVLNKGKELQRCLYAFAVSALLGDQVDISASLLYLRDERRIPLEDKDKVLEDLQQFLAASRGHLEAGHAVPGISAGDDYDDLAFALPANPAKTYMARKWPAILELLAGATSVWEAA